jgi:hypothetical protein
MQTNFTQQIKEAWEGDIDAIGIVERNPSIATQCRYREGHGDAMIAMAPYGATFKTTSAKDGHSILALLDIDTEMAQSLGHGRDSIRLFIT